MLEDASVALGFTKSATAAVKAVLIATVAVGSMNLEVVSAAVFDLDFHGTFPLEDFQIPLLVLSQ